MPSTSRRRLREWIVARRPSRAAVAALLVFAVAYALRIVWVTHVQSPFDAVFSDMAGYVNRALQVAHGDGGPYPSEPGAETIAPWDAHCPCYPPGAHYVYAAEVALVGWERVPAMLALNCVLGAVVAPCALLLTLRVAGRLWVACLVGLFAAAWYPVLTFSGFFSSEQPYIGTLALSAWLLVRLLDRGKGGLALGVMTSIAYLVRPRILLTVVALAGLGVVLLVARRLRLPWLRLAVASAVFSATIAFGVLRHHRLAGTWALISDNAALTRLWADTNYGFVRANYVTPGGAHLQYYFSSPSKEDTGERHELEFDGYIGDAKILNRVREGETNYMTSWERIRRWIGNVRLLFVDTAMWPDSARLTPGWRTIWSDASKLAMLAVIAPLALVGLVASAVRPRLALVVCSAHVMTALVTAAFFYGEIRYRVPYDVFLFVLAVEGARRSGQLVAWLFRRARSLTRRWRRAAPRRALDAAAPA